MTAGRPQAKRISLVLSSGGARGLAHVGAIRCLEDHGYEITYISGSSMGALIGGVYAAGKLDEYETWVRALRRLDIIQLLDFAWGQNGGLFRGERIIDTLKDLVGDQQIADLPIGFTAVATELNRKREVWINEGSLFDAIRASIAVPMVFSAVRRGPQLLLDGAILNPLPIAPTLSHSADMIVAVDVNGQDDFRLGYERALYPESDPAPNASAEHNEPEPADTIRQSIVRFVEDLLSSDEPKPHNPGMFDIALEAMDTMQVSLSRLKLSVYSPDLLVQIPRNVAHFFEFERAAELIDAGYARMEEALGTPPPAQTRSESSSASTP